MNVFINYKQNVSPDHDFAKEVERALKADGHQVFRDEAKIVPGEKWPDRLERAVRDCDAMVSILSDAALESGWVLSEIDLARQLEKRIVPILVSEINESLQFQALRPRFACTQWIPASGDLDADCAKLVEALRETRHECYGALITAKLAEYGCTDGAEILEALCGVLYQSHWQTALGRALRDETHSDKKTEEPTTLAEWLKHATWEIGMMLKNNGEKWRECGEDERCKRMTWQAQRLACFAEMLDILMGAWNRNTAQTAVRVNNNEAYDNAYIFDDSNGEQAFASEYADPLLQRTEPVPKGSVVRVVSVADLKGKGQQQPEHD